MEKKLSFSFSQFITTTYCVPDEEEKLVLMNILNLGCGTNPLKDVVNVDIQPFPGVDVVANAYLLPFLPGSFKQVFGHNPYDYNPLCQEVANLLSKGGLLTVTGQPRNQFITDILETSSEELTELGLELVKPTAMDSSLIVGQPKTTKGKPLNTKVMISVIYRKMT